MGKLARPKLYEVHVRLFSEDVVELKRIAAHNGSHWNIELRQLVRRALRGERREITIISEGT